MWLIWWVTFCLFEIRCSTANISQQENLVLEEGKNASLACTQSFGHYGMFWYRQGKTEGLQLLFNFYDKNLQEKGEIPERFKAEQPQTDRSNLNITSVRREDSAVYFCASSLGDRLYFGQGTRFFVLGEGEHSSPPKVTIFSPSTQELKEKNKATIVCLVTDFYPDHIILTWSVNGKERKGGVNTETPKLESPGKYSLISRLRVTSQEWQNSYNKFDCKVKFYDETKASSYEESIHGIDCDGGIDQTRETYLRTANLGKLVYILLIFKSFLYGAFVMGWKLRKK